MKPHFYFRQVYALTEANLKNRYRKTVAGFLWVILNPIVLYLVQSLIFEHFLKIEIENYSLFLIGGLLPWFFLTQSLLMGVPQLEAMASILKSYYNSPSLFILSLVIENFINILGAFLILLIPLLIFKDFQIISLLLIPFASIPLFVGTFSLVWFLGTAQIFYKDTKFMVHFLINILFFLTPIFYPKELIPSNFHFILVLNPFYPLIEPFRMAIHQPDINVFLLSLLKSSFYSLTYLLIAISYCKRRKNEFYLKL